MMNFTWTYKEAAIPLASFPRFVVGFSAEVYTYRRKISYVFSGPFLLGYPEVVTPMATSMAPPPQTLPDDLIPGILLRLPPNDPAGLVRASAVCKDWRRIITDSAFPARYRALHPTAPVLGFLHNLSNRELPRFVSTTSFCPSDADHHRCHALDCRHGRAVFNDYGSLQSFVVWDPVTGERHKLPDVPDVFTHFCAAGGGCDDRWRSLAMNEEGANII
jgi:hypothetical protein